MRDRREYQPGEPAPKDGDYESLNVLGSPTGHVVHMKQGVALPPAPRGFTWRPVEQRSED